MQDHCLNRELDFNRENGVNEIINDYVNFG